MCGILCMYNHEKSLDQEIPVFKSMLDLLNKRGPDAKNIEYHSHVLLGHCRLSVIDIEGGNQPYQYTYNGIQYSITFNGEIYNMNTLKVQLINEGFHFYSQSDVEVALVSYIAYGKKCLDMFEGIFAFVISYKDQLFIARDHLGVKPLFYYYKNNMLLVSSEIKCILQYLQKAVVNEDGLKELLGLGPSVTPGKTIYKDIFSLRAGHWMVLDKGFMEIKRYWIIPRRVHSQSYTDTVKEVRSLVNKSIHQQLLSDVPISCMLSGGLDSSIITAVSSQYIRNLTTYSVDYQDQEKYFKPYEYQTTRDSHYIEEMGTMYDTIHHDIVLSQKDLILALKESLIARDAPGMADIDSSFLLFSKEIRKQHKVVLSGECADELFGGYPWFYKEELYSLQHFPWILDIDKRIDLLSDFAKSLDIKQHILKQYQQSLNEIDYQDSNFGDTNKRKIIYLNIEWFMQTLLTRGDSQTMRASLELRVPFASKEIVEYMYNVPWTYIHHNGKEKGLLRDAFKDFLPEDIYDRKKNPYPKTHSPIYSALIKELLLDSLEDPSNILYLLFNIDKLKEMIENEGKDFTVPWFGQLMMGPQLLAYFYQIYLWGKLYHIEIEMPK